MLDLTSAKSPARKSRDLFASQADTPPQPHPRVLVVEDEVLARTAVATMLERSGLRVIPVATTEEALEVLGAIPDIKAVVTDVRLSSDGMNGFDLARKVQSERGIGVLVMSGRTGPDTDELPPGTHFLAKPLHEATLVHLVRALIGSAAQPEQVLAESPAPEPAPAGQGLTRRQQEVLEHLAQGKSNGDIAEALGLAESTVKVHVGAIYRVLGVSSRIAAALAGMQGQVIGRPYQDTHRPRSARASDGEPDPMNSAPQQS